MRPICVYLCALCIAGLLPGTMNAQQDRTTYRRDVNGRRVEVAESASTDGERTQRAISINGREVPIEKREERVIREDSRGKVTELVIERFNRNGERVKTERIVTEETRGSGGASTTRQTFFQTNDSGREQEVERRTTQARSSGSGARQRTEVNTTVERADLNGSFRPAEKIQEVTTGTEENSTTTRTLNRKDVNGNFSQAQRTVTTVTSDDKESTTNTAVYRPGSTGRMEMMEQEVERTAVRDDGTTVTETDHYAAAPAGRLTPSGARPQLVEQQVVEQRVQKDGSVLEVTTLRQPTISDPSRLGAPRVISETICRGKCLAPVEEPEKDPDAAADAEANPADPADPAAAGQTAKK